MEKKTMKKLIIGVVLLCVLYVGYKLATTEVYEQEPPGKISSYMSDSKKDNEETEESDNEEETERKVFIERESAESIDCNNLDEVMEGSILDMEECTLYLPDTYYDDDGRTHKEDPDYYEAFKREIAKTSYSLRECQVYFDDTSSEVIACVTYDEVQSDEKAQKEAIIAYQRVNCFNAAPFEIKMDYEHIEGRMFNSKIIKAYADPENDYYEYQVVVSPYSGGRYVIKYFIKGRNIMAYRCSDKEEDEKFLNICKNIGIYNGE